MQNSSMPIFQGILGAAAGAASAMGGDENNLFSDSQGDMAGDWNVDPIPTLSDGMTDWSQAEVF